MVRGMSWPRQTSDTQSRFLPHATHASEPGSVARKPWCQYVPSRLPAPRPTATAGTNIEHDHKQL